MGLKNIIITFILFSINNLFAQALISNQKMQEIKYYKCYQILVSDMPLPNDPRLLQVKSGSIDAATACKQLINIAKLDNNMMLRLNQGATNNMIAKQILHNIQQFHIQTFVNMNPFADEESGWRKSADVINAQMPADLKTISTLSDRHYKYILEENNSIKQKRVSNLNRRNKFLYTNNDIEFRNNFNPSGNQLNELGELVGFANEDRSRVYDDNQVYPSLDNSGILGSPTYIMMNMKPRGRRPDGYMNVARTLVKNIVKDFMCRTIPVLRKQDVISFVQANAAAPFRQGAECMTCHATMGPGSHAFRNKFNEDFDDDDRLMTMEITPVTQNAPYDPFPTSGNSNFYRRAPDGQLNFRSSKNPQIFQSIPVVGTAGLAAALKNTDDFYMCAAKQHLEFLTGIDFQFRDFDDPSVTQYTADEQELFNAILQWADELKNNGNTVDLYGRIIESKWFR